MRKAFKLQDLDCANCAAKMENAIKNIEGVKSASISFMTQKLGINPKVKDFYYHPTGVAFFKGVSKEA